jgi:uncharacterized protein
MSTADPNSARAHARAQAGAHAEAMPIVPARLSPDVPAGVSADAMVWEETIAAGGYAFKHLNRGARLRLTDLHGDGCVSLLVFNAERPVERLNVADTIKVQWNAYLGAGSILLSDMGRPLMSILESDIGAPDALCGASNQASNARKYGDGFNHGAHPNARDRFLIALGKFGLGRKDVHPCINLFKEVRVAQGGGTLIEIGPFAPGRAITLRADMDVIVVLANCPHVLDSRDAYTVTPVRAQAWRGAAAGDDDAVRAGSPETARAFANVDDYFAR